MTVCEDDNIFNEDNCDSKCTGITTLKFWCSRSDRVCSTTSLTTWLGDDISYTCACQFSLPTSHYSCTLANPNSPPPDNNNDEPAPSIYSHARYKGELDEDGSEEDEGKGVITLHTSDKCGGSGQIKVLIPLECKPLPPLLFNNQNFLPMAVGSSKTSILASIRTTYGETTPLFYSVDAAQYTFHSSDSCSRSPFTKTCSTNFKEDLCYSEALVIDAFGCNYSAGIIAFLVFVLVTLATAIACFIARRRRPEAGEFAKRKNRKKDEKELQDLQDLEDSDSDDDESVGFFGRSFKRMGKSMKKLGGSTGSFKWGKNNPLAEYGEKKGKAKGKGNANMPPGPPPLSKKPKKKEKKEEKDVEMGSVPPGPPPLSKKPKPKPKSKSTSKQNLTK
ncbi:hypothetical protein ScalyP_jg1372 [Parmales sp. scaly parma]|nr:hypothetical protein ScalyP_jg1372 [Parmales sp. scaly parma]